MTVYEIQLWHIPLIIIGVLLIYGTGYLRGRTVEIRWYNRTIKPYKCLNENED